MAFQKLIYCTAFFCIGIIQPIYAAENEVRVPSGITQVTVFLNQAQVTRLARVSLQPGITNLVFDRVSPFINLKSVQVKTENSVTLLSVSQRNNYLKNEEKPKFILELEDTVNALKQQLELLKIKRESLILEKDVMISNKGIGGANSGVKIDDLEDVLTLFRKRNQEIGEDLMRISAMEKKLVAIQHRFQSQLDEYLKNSNSAVEIVVTVKTLTAASNATIEWSYLVSQTGWKPFYDIRVKDTKSPLQLVSKAYIKQATGEDWNNVILKLSTANPNEDGTKPELQPSYLRFKETGNYQKQVYPFSETTPASPAMPDMMASTGNAEVSQTPVNIEFNVTSAYSIPSDNNPHQVDLSVNNLEARYAYGAIPKLDKDVFVTAKVSANDLINQVSGTANIYFDGTYTGRTYINGSANDSMLLSLGRDKRIQIQRVMLKDFSSRSFIGGNKKEVNTWEINIRNTRKEPIVLVLEDQVPVSTDKEIEIKLLNAGGATLDETTGKLSWILNLEAEQSQLVRFSFEVRYPKEKQISIY